MEIDISVGVSCMLMVFVILWITTIRVVSYSILYNKLDIYGIRGVSLDFIKADYENRSHYVCYDAVKSSIRSQELGVIQGSKTSPLFFDIYFTDFA